MINIFGSEITGAAFIASLRKQGVSEDVIKAAFSDVYFEQSPEMKTLGLCESKETPSENSSEVSKIPTLEEIEKQASLASKDIEVLKTQISKELPKSQPALDRSKCLTCQSASLHFESNCPLQHLKFQSQVYHLFDVFYRIGNYVFVLYGPKGDEHPGMVAFIDDNGRRTTIEASAGALILGVPVLSTLDVLKEEGLVNKIASFWDPKK